MHEPEKVLPSKNTPQTTGSFLQLFISYMLLMRLFLDTADTSLIRQYSAYGIVDGVTTNPSIIARS